MLHFYNIVRLPWSSALITFMYYNCLYSLYMAATTFYPCLLILFLAVISVNITSTASVCMACMNGFFFFSVLMNWVSYFFPPNFVSRQTTHLPEFYLIGIVFVFLRSLVSISLASVCLSSLSTGAPSSVYLFLCMHHHSL